MTDEIKTQTYSNEIRDAIVQQAQGLQDIVGYHFKWCPEYLGKTEINCTCGMYQIRLNKAKLEQERLDEFSLWQDALGDD